MLGFYMFQHSICHIQGTYSVTLLNYIYTIAVLVKILTRTAIVYMQFSKVIE